MKTPTQKKTEYEIDMSHYEFSVMLHKLAERAKARKTTQRKKTKKVIK